MENKNKKMIIIIGLITVLLIGITVAYFISKDTSVAQSVKTSNIDITYENENTFKLLRIKPINEDKVKERAAQISFTITNNSKTEAYANISIVDIDMSENFKNNDFKWDLYEGENKVSEGSFRNIQERTSISIGSNIYLKKGESKNYTVYIYIKESNEDQSSMINGTFKGKMDIQGYQTPTITEDKSGANEPVLASGMIPVVYDETSENWEVADIDKPWYNYGDGMWANAVTVNDESLRSAKAGTELDMSKINSMWVWIPRYKYRIPSNIGSSSNVTSPPEIDVIFENGTETTGESLVDCPIDNFTCYYTHPAFRNGSEVYKTTAYDQGGWDKELSGLWVGKFESIANIIPDILTGNWNNVKQKFHESLSFAGGEITDNGTVSEVTFTANVNNVYGLNTTNNTTDTHMMKNTEWGAVAYLSQSMYGKMGNPNYSGANKEIYINNSADSQNNSNTSHSGRSGGGPSGTPNVSVTYPDQESTDINSAYGFYTYDDYLLNYNTNDKLEKVVGKGTGASTTGTIYGIYDMSGGNKDYVMANFEGYAASNGYDSGFNGPYGDGTVKTNGISFPTLKYYDKYISNTTVKEMAIKGDATWETQNWYGDTSTMINQVYPWGVRGSYSTSYNLLTPGVFSFGWESGQGNPNLSTRTVLIP